MGLLKSLFGGKAKSGGAAGAAVAGPQGGDGAVSQDEALGVKVLYEPKELARVLKDQPPEVLEAFRPVPLEEAAESRMGAAAWLLGRLREDAKLRAQFPRALSDGIWGEFGRWLETPEAPKRLGVRPEDVPGIWKTARDFVLEALGNPPGEAVLQLWLLKKNWQARYPHLPCESQIKEALRWMLRRGPTEFELSQTAVLWFFQEWGEKLEEGVALTYRVRPEWQEKFPVLLDSATQQKIFIRHAREHLNLELDEERLAAAIAKCPVETDPAVTPAPEPRLKQVLKATGESLLPIELTKSKRLGVNLMGHFCYPSGLQQAALGFMRGARQAGLAVSARDVPVEAERRAAPRTLDVLGMEHYEVSVLMIYPNALFAQTYDLAGLFPRVGVRRIGYWFWESESVPEEVVQMAEGLHEIWVATEYIATAMRARIPGKPVHVCLPSVETPVPAPLTRQELGLPPEGEAYLFGFVFDMSSTLARKNPLGLLKAFETAFGGAAGENDPPVGLVIKTQRGELHPEELQVLEEACARLPNVLLINDSWPLDHVFALIGALDCYVSLHRSEGLGLTMAEAMLLGKPVIATGYSGNLDFMNAKNSLLVPAERVTLEEPAFPFPAGTTWSEPDLEAAALHMRWVRDHAREAADMGARARQELRQLLSTSACGARIRERVEASFLAAHDTGDERRVVGPAMNATTAAARRMVD